MERQTTRKTLESETHRPTHSANNPPDRPCTQNVVFKRIGVLTTNPSGSDSQAANVGSETRHSSWSRTETGTNGKPKVITTQRVETFFTVAPSTPKPLTPSREIGTAGGRTIGGGTSNEALRRARRKASRKP